MINTDLLKILCCPETHQAIELAEADTIRQLNGKIDSGQLRNRAGASVTERIEGGLVRSDGKFLYPIRHNIPILLIDEAIPLGA